ncbi:MAG: isoprenylcysteine carboxylmethyltransferase family protein [Gemmatimonadetes bacterium]|nr:isoprenylcysteine carboxylmethyltransferase family protein [Gemmatimonadota bacterium]
MFALARALIYASLFVGIVLVFLPAQVLEAEGLTRPAAFGPAQIAGLGMLAAGAALVLTCIFSFAFIGRGTPAPFDAPRRLVVWGPYRWVRNPMYAGVVLALLGATLFLQSPGLLAFTVAFWVIVHLFVLVYEEPTLGRLFGEEYEKYRQQVPRWVPAVKGKA